MSSRKENLYKLLEELSPDDASLLTLYQSKNKSSYYCLYNKAPNYFKALRISDHRSHGRRFEIPSFNWKQTDQLRADLTHYINDDTAWFKINYQEFVVLHYVINAQRRRMAFLMEPNHFTGKGPRFYAERPGRRHNQRHHLPQIFRDALQKYYGRGIVNVYSKDKSNSVYVTSVGFELYDHLVELYGEEWMKDRKHLNHFYFELPNRFHPLDQSEEEKQEIQVAEPSLDWQAWKDQAQKVYHEFEKLMQMSWQLLMKQRAQEEADRLEIEDGGAVKAESQPAVPQTIPQEKPAFKNESHEMTNTSQVIEEEIPSKEEVDQEETVHLIKPLEKEVEERSRFGMDEVLGGDSLTQLIGLKEALEEKPEESVHLIKPLEKEVEERSRFGMGEMLAGDSLSQLMGLKESLEAEDE